MLKIYHVKGTRAVRVIWLCEELKVPYEVQVIDFSPDYRNSPEWRSISPTGKVPAMTDGDLTCLLYTSPSPRDGLLYRMPSSA